MKKVKVPIFVEILNKTQVVGAEGKKGIKDSKAVWRQKILTVISDPK